MMMPSVMPMGFGGMQGAGDGECFENDNVFDRAHIEKAKAKAAKIIVRSKRDSRIAKKMMEQMEVKQRAIDAIKKSSE